MTTLTNAADGSTVTTVDLTAVTEGTIGQEGQHHILLTGEDGQSKSTENRSSRTYVIDVVFIAQRTQSAYRGWSPCRPCTRLSSPIYRRSKRKRTPQFRYVKRHPRAVGIDKVTSHSNHAWIMFCLLFFFHFIQLFCLVNWPVQGRREPPRVLVKRDNSWFDATSRTPSKASACPLRTLIGPRWQLFTSPSAFLPVIFTSLVSACVCVFRLKRKIPSLFLFPVAPIASESSFEFHLRAWSSHLFTTDCESKSKHCSNEINTKSKKEMYLLVKEEEEDKDN